MKKRTVIFIYQGSSESVAYCIRTVQGQDLKSYAVSERLRKNTLSQEIKL